MTFKENFPNPYDPNTPDLQPETPPLDQIIQSAIIAAMMKMRVHMPGKIVKKSGNNKVDIQPLIQTRYTNGDVVNLPVIQNVPVGMPQGQDYSIKLPIKVGDTGHILFSDRSLDIWKVGDGGITDPQDSRIHDMTDAVFIPGLVTFSEQIVDDTDDLVLTNGEAQIRLLSDGTFKIQNTGQSQELITILLSLLDTLMNNTFTLTMLGPEPFIASTITALTQINTNLSKLKG